jgi:peptidoglycan/LPS O-acetylase OafA/YrhL
MPPSAGTLVEAAYPVTQSQARTLHSLVGIRGIAAVWVVLFHIYLGIPTWPIIKWLHGSLLLRNGFRGVDLFFVLSGFVMMHAHSRDFFRLSLRSIQSFALSRFFRIYPINFIVSLLIMGLVLLSPGYVTWVRATYGGAFETMAYTPLSFIQTITLSSRWLLHDYGVWNVVTWSLSVEIFAYAFFPFVAVALNKTQSRGRCLAYAIGSIAAMIILLIWFGNWDGGATYRLGLLRGLGGFIAGASMCRFVWLSPANDNTPQRVALVSVTVIAGLIFCPHAAILMPFAFAALVAALSYQRGIVDAVLRAPFVLFLGRVSFSLYLIHLTLFFVLEWLFETRKLTYSTAGISAALLIYLVLVIALAAVLYRFVELPFQRLGRRVVAQFRDSRPMVAPATADPAADALIGSIQVSK